MFLPGPYRRYDRMLIRYGKETTKHDRFMWSVGMHMGRMIERSAVSYRKCFVVRFPYETHPYCGARLPDWGMNRQTIITMTESENGYSHRGR